MVELNKEVNLVEMNEYVKLKEETDLLAVEKMKNELSMMIHKYYPKIEDDDIWEDIAEVIEDLTELIYEAKEDNEKPCDDRGKGLGLGMNQGNKFNSYK